MHSTMRVLAGVLGLAWVCAAWSDQGAGLKPNPDGVSWHQWQGRILLTASVPTFRAGLIEPDSRGLKVEGLSVMGDYYFGRSLMKRNAPGGFRTTSGLLVGPRSPSAATRPWFGGQGNLGLGFERHWLHASEPTNGFGPGDTATLPYLGVGYSGVSLNGGWSINADLGMLALYPGNSIKLGRVVGGTQSLDDLLREMRLTPILKLGVSYSF